MSVECTNPIPILVLAVLTGPIGLIQHLDLYIPQTHIEQSKSIYHNQDTSTHIWWIGIEILFLKRHLIITLHIPTCV